MQGNKKDFIKIMKTKIVLIGGGGHCKVVLDAIRLHDKFSVYGIIDPGLEKGDKVMGVGVLGADECLLTAYRAGVRNAFVTVGSIGDPRLRLKLCQKAQAIGFKFPTILHPRSVVAGDVKIGGGTFIAASATINPGTLIGKHAIINTSCSIDHDCVIGDFVHIAPGVTLSGEVIVGDECHIGTGANVTNGVCVRKKTFIKAGSLVKKSL